MSDEHVVFNQINLVVHDMAAMVEFYDSQSFVTHWNEGWPEGQIGPVFGFQASSAEAVDEIFGELTAAGYAGQQTQRHLRWRPRTAP